MSQTKWQKLIIQTSCGQPTPWILASANLPSTRSKSSSKKTSISTTVPTLCCCYTICITVQHTYAAGSSSSSHPHSFHTWTSSCVSCYRGTCSCTSIFGVFYEYVPLLTFLDNTHDEHLELLQQRWLVAHIWSMKTILLRSSWEQLERCKFVKVKVTFKHLWEKGWTKSWSCKYTFPGFIISWKLPTFPRSSSQVQKPEAVYLLQLRATYTDTFIATEEARCFNGPKRECSPSTRLVRETHRVNP